MGSPGKSDSPSATPDCGSNPRSLSLRTAFNNADIPRQTPCPVDDSCCLRTENDLTTRVSCPPHRSLLRRCCSGHERLMKSDNPKTVNPMPACRNASTLKRLFNGFPPLMCVKASGGSGTGSMVSFSFIDASEESSPGVPEKVGLFLQFAAWRLDTRKIVLCSSTTDNRRMGPMVRSLGLLIGLRARLSVLNEGLDLLIQFGKGSKYRLWIFCDSANEREDHTNYTIFRGKRVYNVGPFSVLQVSRPKPTSPSATPTSNPPASKTSSKTPPTPPSPIGTATS